MNKSPANMSSRVVILGASGYVGGAIHRALSAGGMPVLGLSSGELDLTKDKSGLALSSLLRDDDTLLVASGLTPEHGAGLASFDANMAMANNVSLGLVFTPVAHCVYLSSDAVYGFRLDPIIEVTPPDPDSFYGLAKIKSEALLQSVSERTGQPLLILRLTGVYGPGDPHRAYGPNRFAQTIAKEQTIWLFGAGEEQRDHVYIDDVGRLVMALITVGATGIVNLATGQSRSFTSITDMICDMVPGTRVQSLPPSRPVSHRHFDTARMQALVPGFTFTPFQEGLRATLTAFGALP